jgi:transcriptional regulator with XRE-family HTH domain
MINSHDRQRAGKARLLRRRGKTYDEIRAAIGPVSDDRLQVWLRGIPRPPETNRTGRAKPELRRKVRRLRAEGLTIPEIAEITGASKGSISPWVRDITLHSRVLAKREARLAALRAKGAAASRERAAARQRAVRERARGEVASLTARELFLIGVALYWAEGAKDKPWRRNGRVKFINSDVSVLRVFLAWLDGLGVEEADRRYSLNIHETACVAEHERWWAEQLGL